MELTLRPATPTERLYAKRQCIPIMERCGSPGILVAELDDSGTAFCSHWDIWDPAWKTPEFSVELDAMIEMLRSDQRYHNAVFVGRDRQGQPRYAALRGIIGDFKGEAPGSDKRYSFAIAEDSAAPSVHLFESAIDLLSYATLLKMKGRDWRQDAMLSLGGVFKQKQEFVIPMALSQYLQDHPGVHTLCLHLDNDEVGRDAAAGIMAGLGNRYEVLDRPPPSGKDVNDLLLQRRLGQVKRKEEWSR